MFRNQTSICRWLFAIGILLGSLSVRAISDSPGKATAPNSSIATARFEIGRGHIKMELARLYMEQRKCSEALPLVHGVPNTGLPSELIALKAACLTAVGHSSEAAALIAQTQILKRLNNALDRNPKSVRALLAISQVHSAQNQHEESMTML